MRKLAAYILVTLVGIIGAQAQSGKPVAVEGIAEFDKVVHDFGDFLLSDGAKSCSFAVKNIGKRPFAILQVVSSCGCTDVTWTKSPVKEGESGVISATYSNDQGAYPFEKTLTVYISSLDKPVILRLRGNVTEKKKPLAELYPVHIGSLGLKDTSFKVGNINQGGERSDFAMIANIGKQPLRVSFKDVSANLTVLVEPEVIAPGSTGRLIFTVKADRNLWGKNRYTATPVVSGRAGQKLEFHAYTKEDFSGWTKEQREKASQPMSDVSTFNFGKVKAGTPVEAVFNLRNDGKSQLKLYKADSDNPAATPGALPSLAPGEKGTFKVKLDTAKHPKGEVSVIVTLTTNSPLRPIVNLFVCGAIE
ncbi:MAG: DUF1573 domain-containing protein [Bacteroidales bacterium]|nr:DUF1573 domain-containing protein [Bacteroidales bacterium]